MTFYIQMRFLSFATANIVISSKYGAKIAKNFLDE